MEQDSSTSPPPKADSVQLKILGEDLDVLQEFSERLKLKLDPDNVQQVCTVRFLDDSGKEVFAATVKESSQIYQAATSIVFLRVPQGSAVVTLPSQNATSQLLNQVYSAVCSGGKKPSRQSVFSLRTEESSAKQYFQFYGYLSQQQNMMQDFLRTSTYQSAMLQNCADFKDKVVLDVGAGSGILSFFAVQAGARRVYAVEASSIAVYCQQLVQSNRVADKIFVIAGKIEEVDIPEPVDVIISEPMGYMLFNERMLESFLFAKKWLKPEGQLYPTEGILYCSPFSDEALFMEQNNKAYFWYQQFHGVDLSCLKESAVEEYFKQPVVDTFDVRILMAKPVGHTTDFRTATEESLYNITIPVSFKVWSTGSVHGLAFWFDVSFLGSQSTVWLSTAPFQALTHWYQVRCLLQVPLFVHTGQELHGTVVLKANERQSYDVEIKLKVAGTSQSTQGSYDLKNPYFRYTGITATPPPGSHHTSPTETWGASAQAGGTASGHARGASAYMAQAHAQSITLAPSNNPATTYPMVNGAVIPSVQQQQQQQGTTHPVSFQPSQTSSQLQYGFPQGAIFNPMATAAASQYFLQTQGQVSYASPVLYQKNAGTAPASYSVASHS